MTDDSKVDSRKRSHDDMMMAGPTTSTVPTTSLDVVDAAAGGSPLKRARIGEVIDINAAAKAQVAMLEEKLAKRAENVLAGRVVDQLACTVCCRSNARMVI
jgi:hypothetical protein